MSEAIASKEERLVRYNANIAAADKDPQLSPETGKPLSKVNTIRFGAATHAFSSLVLTKLQEGGEEVCWKRWDTPENDRYKRL